MFFSDPKFLCSANIPFRSVNDATRYVLFVRPPLKRNIIDKDEFNFDVMCFVFLKVSFRSIK